MLFSVWAPSICVAFATVGTLGAQIKKPDHVAFHSFMEKYGRRYADDSDEYRRRQALFARRAGEAEAHNARPGRLWTAAANDLFDRTAAEFAQLRGWRGAAAAAARPKQQGRGPFLGQRSNGQPLPQAFMNWTSLKSTGRIRAQRGCGSCWAFAAATVLQLHSEIYSPESSRTFSPQELVSCVANRDGCGGAGGCRGATVELAFDWALRHGLAQESETPYAAVGGACKKAPGLSLVELETSRSPAKDDLTSPGIHHAPEGALGLAFGMKGWERLPENNYETLLRTLYERGPVGVSVDSSTWLMYGSGIFNNCGKDNVIDHSVVLIGYGKERSTGLPFYLLQNSWGVDWGESGLIRLLRSDSDGQHCGVDRWPEQGTGCRGGPKPVTVCGMCGILYDSAVPHFQRTSA